MKNKIRHFSLVICSTILLLIILLPFPSIAKANTGTENIQWAESSNISHLKEWKVTFSGEIDPKSVDANSVYVISPDGEKTGVTPYIDSSGETIIVPAPVGGYKKGATYTLHVTSKVKELNGKVLKIPVSKAFTISEHSSEDYLTFELYNTSFEIVNTSSEGKYIHLSADADTSSYTEDLRLTESSKRINYVNIPPKGTAVVSFDEKISSPLAETASEIRYHLTDEPAFWRVKLSSDSAVALTKISDAWGSIEVEGGDFFTRGYGNRLNIWDVSQYGAYNTNLPTNSTEYFQPPIGSEISIHAPFRSYSLEELPQPFVDQYLVEPTKTAVLTTDKAEARLLVDKESNYDYADYSSYWGMNIGVSEITNHFKPIPLSNDTEYIITNTGDKSFFIAGLAGTFSIKYRDEAALQSEILQPNSSRVITNNTHLQSAIYISGQGTLDYASYNRDGSTKGYGQLALTKERPDPAYVNFNGMIVITNTGDEPLQISFPFMQHQAEATESQALQKEIIEPGVTTIWKNTFPVLSNFQVIGEGHIDFVEYNSIGHIQSFGRKNVNQQSPYLMYLWSNNASIITNSGTTSLKLIGPYNNFTIHEGTERALQAETVESGKTLVIQPTQSSSSSALIVAEGSYDYVEYRDNHVMNFNKKVYPPAFKSEETFYIFGEFLLTNKGEKPLAVYVPNKSIILNKTDEFALIEKTIQPGEMVILFSTSASQINIVLSGSGPYHYVSKDNNQTIISENRLMLSPAWTNQQSLSGNGTLEIANESNQPITIYGPARFLTVQSN